MKRTEMILWQNKKIKFLMDNICNVKVFVWIVTIALFGSF